MNYWKKRTRKQIEGSIDKKDYTGGYKFWPWLIYMRSFYVVGILGNIFLGWYGGLSVFNEYSDNPGWIGYAMIASFGVCIPVLLSLLLRREYFESKRGIKR